MSWPQICVIALATAVPVWLWGYRCGYKKATSDAYGPDVLQNSAADLASEDREGST